MLGRLIEWSVRNVFLVLGMTLAGVAGGIYAVMRTPLDAQPDLAQQFLPARRAGCQVQLGGHVEGKARFQDLGL